MRGGWRAGLGRASVQLRRLGQRIEPIVVQRSTDGTQHKQQSIPCSALLSAVIHRFIYFSTTMGNKVSLEENLIDLKIVAKQMVRSSKKCEKNEAAAIAKLKKVRFVRSISLSPPCRIIHHTKLNSRFTIMIQYYTIHHRPFNRVIRKERGFTDKTRYGKRIKH
jgi:hypothetical protein